VNRYFALDRLLQEVVDQRLLSGAVSMVWRHGSLEHTASIGWRDVEARTPMQLDSIFRLYSMTKPVTAIAMMVLWDEGKWSPDDAIAKFLPELADLKVLRGMQPDGTPILSAPASPPTLEHLMTHQAGFGYGLTDDQVDVAMRAADVPGLPSSITADEYVRRLSQLPLAFDPGTAWRYSAAMDVQGVIIERLSGMGLREFMRSRIFAPLGMADTDFLVPRSKLDRFASLYTLFGSDLVKLSGGGREQTTLPNGFPARLILDYDTEPLFPSGGGGLVSTAPDYLRLALMLHQRGVLDGVRILSEKAVAHMTRTHISPAIAKGAFGIAPHWIRPGYEYAYNGVVVTDPVLADVPLGRGTYFWDGAAGAWFWIDPENDLVIVTMQQLLVEAERLGLQFRTTEIIADILRKA